MATFTELLLQNNKCNNTSALESFFGGWLLWHFYFSIVNFLLSILLFTPYLPIVFIYSRLYKSNIVVCSSKYIISLAISVTFSQKSKSSSSSKLKEEKWKDINSILI